MSTSTSSNGSEEGMQGLLTGLIYSGWALTLSYFPSGLLHFYLSSAVYLRDLCLAAHLSVCFWYLSRLGALRWLGRQAWLLGLAPLMLIPAVLSPEYRFEALRTVKWSFSWLDWMFLGFLASRNRRWDGWLGVFAVFTGAELLTEWIVGFVEWREGHYLFSTATKWGEKTMFGVQEVKEMSLLGSIRVRGLQRDVFSFANLMAMSAVLGLAGASLAREVWVKAAGFAWAAFFAVMLVVSGGRSALFGIFAAALLALAYTVNRVEARRWSGIYLCFWLAAGLAISAIGVGALTDFVSGATFGKSHLGDSTSAYMRDDNWRNMFTAFGQGPIILVTGGPIASLLDSAIDPMFHWADNQYLWNLYHLGCAGALGSAFYFVNILRLGRPEGARRAVDCVIFFLLLVMGEGIARESFTFMGCMPLFVACGYVCGPAFAAGREPRPERERRRRRSRRETLPQLS